MSDGDNGGPLACSDKLCGIASFALDGNANTFFTR
jgi:hypothetical protein